MRGRWLVAVAGVLWALSSAQATAPEITRTFALPFARAWTATESALKSEGWSIDHADRPTGVITTRSRRLAGDDDGMQAINRRVRLHLRLAPVDPEQTSVRIEREQFIRERVLWVEKDRPLSPASHDPIVPPDRTLEERVLAAIARAS